MFKLLQYVDCSWFVCLFVCVTGSVVQELMRRGIDRTQFGLQKAFFNEAKVPQEKRQKVQKGKGRECGVRAGR